MSLTLTVEQKDKLQGAQSEISSVLTRLNENVRFERITNCNGSCIGSCEGKCKGCQTCSDTSTSRRCG